MKKTRKPRAHGKMRTFVPPHETAKGDLRVSGFATERHLNDQQALGWIAVTFAREGAEFSLTFEIAEAVKFRDRVSEAIDVAMCVNPCERKHCYECKRTNGVLDEPKPDPVVYFEGK